MTSIRRLFLFVEFWLNGFLLLLTVVAAVVIVVDDLLMQKHARTYT